MKLLEMKDISADAFKCIGGPAIYFLFSRGELVYIGCSSNYMVRIGHHSSGRFRKEFDAYSVIQVPDGVVPITLERAYIRKYRPRLNSILGNDPRIDEHGNSALDRAMIRMKGGETAEEAAVAENLTIGAVRERRKREKRADEKDQLLLPSVYARPPKAGVGKHGHANIGVHTTGDRSRAQKNRPLKAEKQAVF